MFQDKDDRCRTKKGAIENDHDLSRDLIRIRIHENADPGIIKQWRK
jgi:hypothetical protein